MKEIRGFTGRYDFLSNFYHSPITTPKGLKAATVEHLFQAAKTTDPNEAARILSAPTPMVAKQMGRRVSLRRNWESKKHQWMKEFLRWKFNSSPELKARLLATGDALLVEDNTWHDNHWGNCTCSKCRNRPGRNVLGILLMEIRAELADEARRDYFPRW